MDLEEQCHWFDDNAELAVERVLQEMMDSRSLLVSKARHRLVSGFYEYGDTTWNLTSMALREELLEELSDAIVYQVMRQHSALEEMTVKRNIIFEPDPVLERALSGGPDD